MNQTSALHHWSGELLCSFGLYLAQKRKNILCLVNFQAPEAIKLNTERMPLPVLRRLSDSLALPLFMPPSTSESVQKDVQALLSLVNQKYGVHSVVLNSFEQDDWMNVLKKEYEDCSLEIHNFIEQSNPEILFEEAMELGFKAHIFSVNEKVLNRSYLGALLTTEMLQNFKENNIHPFGAKGEFNTICVDGPNFKHKTPLTFADVHFRNGYWYREIALS